MQSRFLVVVLEKHPRDGGCGMSTRPGYYSCRGATSTDLNSEKLGRIHAAITANVSEEAGGAFAQMVADIPKLTATDFLLTLEAFEANGWKWDKHLLGRQNGVYAANAGEAMGSLMAALGGRREIDETVSIRSDFLRRQGIPESRKDLDPYRAW